jgi:hypothetical protein
MFNGLMLTLTLMQMLLQNLCFFNAYFLKHLRAVRRISSPIALSWRGGGHDVWRWQLLCCGR